MIADTLRRAHLVDGRALVRRWRSWSGRRRARCRCCRRALAGGRGAGRRWPAPSCRWPRSRGRGRCWPCCAARCSPARSTRRRPPTCSPAAGRHQHARPPQAPPALHAVDTRSTPATPPAAAQRTTQPDGQLDLIGGPAADAGQRVAALLDLARRTAQGADRVRDGAGRPFEVLSAVWQRSGLGPGLAGGQRDGGSRGEAADRGFPVRTPHRVALFDTATHLAEPGCRPAARRGCSSTPAERPGDSRETLANRAPQGEAVALHRAPGQGPGVGRGGGGRRAGGQLARPADAVVAAGHGRAGRGGRGPGPAGRGRRGRGRAGLPAAARGAPGCSTSR